MPLCSFIARVTTNTMLVAVLAVFVAGCTHKELDLDSTELASEVLTEDRAVEIALDWASRAVPGASPVEVPEIVDARLMRHRQYAEATGDSLGSELPLDAALWIVQLKGRSTAAFPGSAGTDYAYALMILDAEDGSVIGQRRDNGLWFE